MRTIILLLLLLLLASSCRVVLDAWDPDPLYNRLPYAGPPVPQQRYWDPTLNFGWPGYYYWSPVYPQRERVIIIRPEQKTNYGKRPSRESGNYNPNFRPERGRSNQNHSNH